MVLNEFPDLAWLKQQVNTAFANRTGVNGRILKTQGWPTVVMNVQTRGIYRDNIRGPFSLFGNLSGKSLVHIGNRQVKVNDGYFFITNSGQHYSLKVDHQSNTETFNIHFGDQLIEQLTQSQTSVPEKLLDNEFDRPNESFQFYNRLIRRTSPVNALVYALQTNKDELREEELLSELFISLFKDQIKLTTTAQSLPSIKKSTREEIFKRILQSIDYVHTFYNRKLSLDELAAVSCISKFHFLRLFKIAIGKTPYQFINELRIERSKELLSNSRLEVKQIADEVGFDDSSSFSRVFFQQVGSYPTQFRNK